jgi:hypothetical protein
MSEIKDNNGLLAYACSTHGFILCQSNNETEVVLKHGFNRTFCEVRLPVEVWALFLRSAKEAPIYHGSMKNADYTEGLDNK